MCVGGFELISQVSSTLWPDINRRNYQSTDSGSDGTKVMQEPNSNESRQANPNADQTRRPNTACQKKLGVVGSPGRLTDLPGRPTWPVGPTTSARARGATPLAPYVGCAGFIPWLPAINTRGVENRTHTHHSPRLSCIPCVAFRLSGV